MKKVAVLGSINADMTITLKKLPERGQTMTGGHYEQFSGGKGGNTAVAARRAGAAVSMIGKTGCDDAGRRERRILAAEGIDVLHLGTDHDTPTGTALIMVDSNGENMIAVAPGANGRVSPEDVDNAHPVIEEADILAACLEVPVATVARAAAVCHKTGTRFVLTAAPVRKNLFEHMDPAFIDVLVCNETEAQQICGMNDHDKAIDRLSEMGIKAVVITLGAKGAIISDKGEKTHIEAFAVQTVDTVGAGDAFTGALCTALADGETLADAALFANAAGALAATGKGARCGPSKDGILSLLKSRQTV